MRANAFINNAKQPTGAELTAELGRTKVLWDRLLEVLTHDCGLDSQEWNSYSRKAGWSLRVKHRARNVLYLSPHKGCFTASFALSDRGVRAARAAGFPPPVLKIIDDARRYAEGTAIRIEVRAAKDIRIVEKLAAIKLTN
jgi:hypothetical protein